MKKNNNHSNSKRRKFLPKHLRLFRDECVSSNKNGLQGKVSIHPNQIQIINSVFNKQQTKTYAETIVKRFNKLRDGTMITVNTENEMIDTPSYRMYSRLLAKN